MAIYKSESVKDEKVFIPTQAYKKLYNTFKSLKYDKGRFIHIIGSPGTGKSINIYHALANLDLKVYEPVLLLDNVDKSSREIYREIFAVIKKDLHSKTKMEAYKKASEFDLVLFADKLLDSEYLQEDKIGISKWIENKGVKSLPLYLLLILEYLKHKKDLNKINLVLHHSMVINYKGMKYDLFIDFGPLSQLIKGILSLFFEVIQISYLDTEIIEIVKTHPQYKNEEQIKKYIQKYGNKPRLIYEALENNKNSV